MTKRYDAFGREIDEDTLEGLGAGARRGTAPGEDRPTAGAAPPAAPVPAAPAPASRSASGSRWPGVLLRLGLLVVVLAVVGKGVSAVVSTAGVADDVVDAFKKLDATSETRTSSSSSSTTTVHPDGRTTIDGRTVSRSRAPRGLERGSLLRPAGFRRVLARLRARGGRVLTLRVAPERVDATIVVGRRLRVVQVTWRGAVTDLVATNVPSGLPALALSQVDGAAPARIATRAARSLGRGTSRVSYVALSGTGGQARWTLFFSDGVFFTGSADGRSVSRLG